MFKKIVAMFLFIVMATTMLTVANPSDKIKEKKEYKEPTLIIENETLDITEGEDINLLDGVKSDSKVKTNIESTKKLPAGTYQVKYSVQKKGGNSITKSATLNVHSKPPVIVPLNNYMPFTHRIPIITILDNIYTIEKGTNPTFSAKAIDCYYNNINVKVSSSVDTNTVGTYKVLYTAVDNYGYSNTVTKEVNVVDTTKPIITMTGNSEDWTNEDIHLNFESNEEVTYYYSYNGKDFETFEGTLDFYETTNMDIYYYGVDNSGNQSDTEKTTIRIDKDAPIITNTIIEVEDDIDLDNIYSYLDVYDASEILENTITDINTLENGIVTFNITLKDICNNIDTINITIKKIN